MAGHSKWANIKHKKAATDAKRGRIWTRLIKEITVAARMGGADADSNPRLRLAMDRAAASNMPKDNVQRAITRGLGEEGGANFESVRYEGYGVNGVAIIVDCLTDNRTRTVAEVRHAFSKNGGNMATEGAVAFQFTHCGQFLFAPTIDEGALMDVALDAGADDVSGDTEDGFEVVCAPMDFARIQAALNEKKLSAEVAQIVMKPSVEIECNAEDSVKTQKLIDALENLDDVQEVYSNALFSE